MSRKLAFDRSYIAEGVQILAGEKQQLCLTDRFDISRQNACANNQD
jgi:hypothetical protein